MSVLIEAMTLVVARHALDRARPGGTAAFLQSAAARPDVRYAIADAHFVAVSTLAPAALDALGNQLAPYGIHRRDGGKAVLVDMEMGPLGLCEWLTVRRHPHGLTIAAHRRIAAQAPRLVTPPAWRPTQSWQLARTDLRDDPAAQLLHLGDAHGRAQHLDFRTGAVLTGFAAPSPVRVIQAGAAAARQAPVLPSQPVMTAALRVLAGIGATFRLDGDQRGLVLVFHLDDHDGAVSAPDDRLRVLLHPDSTPAVLRVDVVLPCLVGGSAAEHTAANLAALARVSVRDDVDQLSAHHDAETGTVALMATIPRRRRESLVRAVGRAFAVAAHIGTAATHGARYGQSLPGAHAMTLV
ncbi:MAG: hypothetical protein P3B76_09530 [Gemmatimonadota bacterium]|nr:hypothetical protein [Gemmatimonadota bacterium]